METCKKAVQIESIKEKTIAGTSVFREEEFSIRFVRIQSPFEGIPELHQFFHDVYIVFEGEAHVVTSSQLTLSTEESLGEWRGGIMSGTQDFFLKKGDILVIPAGIPHFVEVTKGDLFQGVIKIAVIGGPNGGSR